MSPITINAILTITEPPIVKPCHTRKMGEHMRATMIRHIRAARNVFGPIRQESNGAMK